MRLTPLNRCRPQTNSLVNMHHCRGVRYASRLASGKKRDTFCPALSLDSVELEPR